MSTDTGRIRVLNDLLRTTGLGGVVVLTGGIVALPRPTRRAVLEAVQHFTAFTPDNDPHGEHDFALLQAAGEWVMFKIDYFDPTLTGHSEDPADPDLTLRVLTIMLSREY